MHPNCDAVNDILRAAGLPGRVRMLDEAVATARAAAQYLGCPVGAIANSLVFATSGGEPLLIMTSGAHRVDMAKVGDELEVQLRRASPEFVRDHTGQPIGGVAPVGHPKPISIAPLASLAPRGSRLDCRLLRRRSQRKEHLCSLLLSTAARAIRSHDR
ncbi:MAG TPA: YbaK/EbsC family protein [Propionibacteriaceae bacterium]|nr:YbaK/EbsC family protein [Propionibacteriaceae bacterium]